MKFFQDADMRQELHAMDLFSYKVAAALTDAMERRGMTRTELAAKLGMSLNEVTVCLSGKRDMSLRMLASMLNAMEFRADIVVTDSVVRETRRH